MKIAIEGCAHGELEQIYDTIQYIEKKENIKVDLLICCGDFQSTRNQGDLNTMAVPKKFQDMCTFYKYYSGEKVAPILTIFIGGNHEASNFLQELPYGGWVAKNIYYMGYAGVVNVNGVRIAGVSGIFKNFDFLKGRYESPPYSEDTKRSVYHIRNLDVWRMKQLSGHVDICISHDWPRGIYHFGDTRDLIRSKPFFAGEIDSNSLGSPTCQDLLHHLKPSYWFSAHLHCKFAAVVEHDKEKSTKFLALDKCLPKRKFLQIQDVGEVITDEETTMEYDLEWLTILHITNHLISVKNCPNYLPNKNSVDERFIFTPTEQELDTVRGRLGGKLKIEETFERTARPYNPATDQRNFNDVPVQPVSNPQTRVLCDLLNIDDPLHLVLALSGREFETYAAPPEAEDDRDVVFDEEGIVERTRTSLSLPAPKLDDEGVKLNPEEINLSDDGEDDGGGGGGGEEIVKEKDLPEEERTEATTAESIPEQQLMETVEKIEVDPNPVVEESTPPVKKFKRRNESIYNTANSDDE